METRKKLAGIYSTPLQEVFHLNKTDDDKETKNSNIITEALEAVLLNIDIEKLFFIRRKNEEYHRFVSTNIKSLDVLLYNITNGKLNQKFEMKRCFYV